MITPQIFRSLKKCDWKIANKYYIGLIKDLHHKGEVDIIIGGHPKHTGKEIGYKVVIASVLRYKINK